MQIINCKESWILTKLRQKVSQRCSEGVIVSVSKDNIFSYWIQKSNADLEKFGLGGMKERTHKKINIHAEANIKELRWPSCGCGRASPLYLNRRAYLIAITDKRRTRIRNQNTMYEVNGLYLRSLKDLIFWPVRGGGVFGRGWGPLKTTLRWYRTAELKTAELETVNGRLFTVGL